MAREQRGSTLLVLLEDAGALVHISTLGEL